MTPSSGATLENTDLLRYKLDQMVKELQNHHRAFSLRYRVQRSAAQTEGGRKSFMCFAFTCLPSNPRAEIQLGVGWGQNILLHRGCIIDGGKPTWSFCQPLSQLAVETEEEKNHSRHPVPCFIPHNWVFSWRAESGKECNLQLHTRGDWKAQAQNEKLKSFGASF